VIEDRDRYALMPGRCVSCAYRQWDHDAKRAFCDRPGCKSKYDDALKDRECWSATEDEDEGV